MALVKTSLKITNNHDLLACLGVAAVTYGCANQFSDVLPKFIHKAFESASSRAIIGFGMHAAFDKDRAAKMNAANSYAYWAVAALFEGTARNYSNQYVKSYAGLACIYFVTNFALECLTRKISGYEYDAAPEDQTKLLLQSSAFSALIKTTAAMAGEFIPVALGFKEPGLIKFIIQTATTGITRQALDKAVVDAGYGER